MSLADLFGLAGQTAVVTGASRGLGARFAEVLHAAGATVVPVARNLEELERMFGDRDGFLPLQCDITGAADRTRVVSETLSAFGRIDVLVNNAGITGPDVGSLDQVETAARVIDVDLTSLFAMAFLVSEPMRRQESGSIINISSMSGLIAVAPLDDHAYCAAKGGVVNLTRQIGAQWIRQGIRVNSIAPGPFHTGMSDATLISEKSKRMIHQECPMGRAGELDEIDGALLFLAGPGSTFVTGQVLSVDGGWTAR